MISLPQSQLHKALRFAGSVVGRRNTIPVLGTVKAVANGALTLTGTDLDMFASATLPYEGEAGEFLLPEPGKLATAIKTAGGETITFDKREKELRVETGELSADMSSTHHPDDFPAIDRIAETLLTATVGADFIRALNRVRPAISTEKTRYYLNGVSLTKLGDWQYRLCATDGHRLFLADIALPDAAGDLPDNIIIPRRAIDRFTAAFAKASDGARFTIGGAVRSNAKDSTLAPSVSPSRAAFIGEIEGIKCELVTKLIDGTYPDVSRVIPGEQQYAVRCRRADMVKAIKSLTPLSGERTRAVRLAATKGTITVELHSPDIGKSRFPIAAEHALPKDFQVGFNREYLLDALNAYSGEEVVIGLDDPAAPATVTDPSDTAFKVVLMPMRF